MARTTRSKGGQRVREDRQWRKDWDQDIDDAWWERLDVETLGISIARRGHDGPIACLEKYYDYRPVWAHPLVG